MEAGRFELTQGDRALVYPADIIARNREGQTVLVVEVKATKLKKREPQNNRRSSTSSRTCKLGTRKFPLLCWLTWKTLKFFNGTVLIYRNPLAYLTLLPYLIIMIPNLAANGYFGTIWKH